MIQRCSNPKQIQYPNYGGRGITVCGRWMDFRNFLEDMGERPQGRSIERTDNNGNYEPGNCRWATTEEQACNKRTTHYLELHGVRQSISRWAKFLGISVKSLHKRLLLGWSDEEALTTLIGVARLKSTEKLTEEENDGTDSAV
jgi:hypothetical protein